ncbi:MAG: sulfate transporter CysZ [Gammaproteobacteria bacterium]|nr:sulfate transporter CysZ [Gammaproteobacteria bacterium]
MDNPLVGIKYLAKGLRLIATPGLRRYVVIPLLINTVLFIAVIWFGFGQLGTAIDWLMTKLPNWLQWLSWLFYLVFGLMCLLFVFFSFSLFANIIAAPFNDVLCSAVLKKLGNGIITGASSQPGFLQQIAPSILNEIKKFVYFAGWSIPFLILLVIPGINIIGSVLWFLFSAWMLNFEYMEYPMSQHNLDFAQQKALFKKRKILSYSFGSVVSIATLIPVLNFLVMPAAVAGAAALWIEQYKK